MGVAVASLSEALGYPQQEIVAVADRAYASLKLLERCPSLSKPITFVSRLRLDAALYYASRPRHDAPIRWESLGSRALACQTFP